MTAAIVLDGFHLRVDGDEPRVRDLDLGERAGLKLPRDIRRTIKAAVTDKAVELADGDGVGGAHAIEGPRVWLVRELVAQPNGGSQPADVYYLNEEAALLVLTRLRTKVSVAVTRALVTVFVKVRRGDAVEPSEPTPTPARLDVDKAASAIHLALDAGAIDKAGAALRLAALVKASSGYDVLAVPEGLSWQKALPQAAELAEGESLIVTKPVDRTGHYSAGELGAPFGLSGKVVGAIADKVGGIKGNPVMGKWSPITDGAGKKVGNQWLYNDNARAYLLPDLTAERDRRASKQLPLGKRGGA